MRAPAHSPPRITGPTEGPRAAAIARRVLGQGPLPWQQVTLNRGLERQLLGGGRSRWRYRVVVVTIARQNGKSWLLKAVIAHRLAGRRGETVGALSHLRSVGREIMFDPLADAFTGRGLRDLFDAHAIRSNGVESLSLRATGGRLVMPSSSEKGGHGYSLDVALVDEAWALKDYRVPQAITPTQIARPDPQLWVVSTAGTAESLWLRELVEAGRAGGNDRLALFEWCAPAELDPSDVAAWEAANPALGHTITIDELAHAFSIATTPESRAEFERAHLNRWTAKIEAIISPQAWRACLAAELTIGPELVVGFDVALDRSRASIVAAGVVGERVLVELVAARPGTDWVVPALAELREKWSPLAIVASEASPARSVIDEARAAGVAVEPYKAPGYAAACQTFYDLVLKHRLAHRGQAELDEAARVVGRRSSGESWVFGRAVSSGEISPLVAATIASHRASRPHIVPRLVVG
jgi:Terminase large subunit, endonuclease domain